MLTLNPTYGMSVSDCYNNNRFQGKVKESWQELLESWITQISRILMDFCIIVFGSDRIEECEKDWGYKSANLAFNSSAWTGWARFMR